MLRSMCLDLQWCKFLSDAGSCSRGRGRVSSSTSQCSSTEGFSAQETERVAGGQKSTRRHDDGLARRAHEALCFAEPGLPTLKNNLQYRPARSIHFCCTCSQSCSPGNGFFLLPVRIFYAQRALRREHLKVLDVSSQRASNLQLQAGWAAGEWSVTVSETLGVLCDQQALRRLGLSLDGSADPDMFRDMETFLAITISAAAQRAWSVASWSEIAPHNWAQILHSSADVACEGLRRIQEDCETVCGAWEKIHTDGVEAGFDADQQARHQ